jgi:hypothetical protein
MTILSAGTFEEIPSGFFRLTLPDGATTWITAEVCAEYDAAILEARYNDHNNQSILCQNKKK